MSEKEVRSAGELFRLAAGGDAEALWELALLGYWEYEPVVGKPSKRQLMRYAEAAGSNGDAHLEKKVGDFFRFEFQDDRAEVHYASAHGKMLRLAMAGDAEAQFEIAMQFAYGQGCEQNDRNACFWCLLAAQNGHEEAQFMMSNFWKSDTAFPVCAEMAEYWTQTAQKSKPMPQESKEIKDVQAAAVQAQYVDDEIAAVSKQLEMKKPVRYRVWNSSRNPILAVTNFISDHLSDVMYKGFWIYALVTILVYIIVFFTGYKETGFVNVLNHIYAFCLRVPIETVSGGSMTLEALCNDLHAEGNIIISLFTLCLGALLPLIWLVIVALGSYIAYCILKRLFIRKGLFVNEVPYSGADEAAARKQLKQLEEKRAAQAQVLAGVCKQHQVPEKLQNAVDLLGICNIAVAMQCDFGTAMAKYIELVDAGQPDMESTELRASKETFSRMALYFILPRIGMTGDDGNRVTLKYSKAPAQNFDVEGPFMRGYIAYRRGYNFKTADEAFQEAVKGYQGTKAEKGYAAWYLAALNRSELAPTGYNEELDKTCRKNVTTYEKQAEKLECPFTVMTAEEIGNKAWRLDAHMLDTLSKLYEKADETFSEYLHDMALKSLMLQYECGNPFNMAEWNGRETNCIWPQYRELRAEVDAIYRSSGSFSEEEEAAYYRRQSDLLTPVKQKCYKLRNRGLTRGDELYTGVEGDVSVADYVATKDIREAQEQRQRAQAAKERAINQQMQEWNERTDAFERALNANISGSYATQFERSLTGDISQQDYLNSDSLRYQAEKQYRAKLEKEYDE